MRRIYSMGLVPAILVLAAQVIHGQTAPDTERKDHDSQTVEEDGELREDPESAVPNSVAGQDVVGEKLPIASLRWLDEADSKTADETKATLVRWWTDGCPYCVSSLPVLESLQQEFGARGLACKAVYHPKPPRKVPDESIINTARKIGFTGPVAIDPDWGFLKEHYLDKGRRHATSVSFLLDESGTIRFVHGGPVIGVSASYQSPEIEAEYENLRAAIRTLLSEDSPDS